MMLGPGVRAVAAVERPDVESAESRDPLEACFHEDYYRSQLEALGFAEVPPDLLDFYRSNADARMASPNPAFDEAYYLAEYADVASAVRSGWATSGFDHFVRYGIQEGRFPNRAFAVEIGNTVPFSSLKNDSDLDEAFYLAEYDAARRFLDAMPILSPIEFFDAYGRRMGHAPRADRKGAARSRLVEPGRRPGVGQPGLAALFQAHFDAAFYERSYGRELNGVPPFAHYVTTGHRERKSPNDWFDEDFYLSFYSDLAKEIGAGRLSCGFEHYLTVGRREGRLPAFNLGDCLELVAPGITKPVALGYATELERKLTPHPYRVAPDRPQRIWFLVPRINPDIFFGGYTTVINLMEAFLRSGYAIGLLLSEDVTEAFNYYCHRRPRSLLAERRKDLEIVSAIDKKPFVFGPHDAFIAYSAWQALWADAYAKATARGCFAFLVQEHESIFHSHDSVRFVVDMAYKLPHVALFNSHALETYFRQQRLGPFEHEEHPQRSLTFEHVLTRVAPPTARELRKRTSRKLLVYARPEAHAARNLLEICLIALRRAIAAGTFRQKYQLVGIGALAGPHYVDLGMGHCLEILSKVDPDGYAKLLQETDVGLSLMYAPHPSLMPFEMANAGAITITNTFSNRDYASIKARSPRLVPVDPTVDSIVQGLQRAVRLAEDVELRTDPAHAVASPAAWSEVFDRQFIERLLGMLSAEQQRSRPRLS